MAVGNWISEGRDESLFKPTPSEVDIYQRSMEDLLADSYELDEQPEKGVTLYPFCLCAAAWKPRFADYPRLQIDASNYLDSYQT